MHIPRTAVITESKGQCPTCAKRLTTVLIAGINQRQWWPVEWDYGAGMWLVHEHPEQPERKAA